MKTVCSADGVSIRQNNERHGGQDVFHVHFHVVPRFAGDGFTTGDDRFPLGAREVSLEESGEQARKVAEALGRLAGDVSRGAGLAPSRRHRPIPRAE